MATTARTKQGSNGTTMGGVVSVGYGIGCYLAFVVVFCYAVAFLGDVVVAHTVDAGGPDAGTFTAVSFDVALLAVFAVQHSVMARPAFKHWWTRLVPRHIERSTYVLVASSALALVLWQWHPISADVWDVPAPAVRVLLWELFATGWAWVLAMSFAIDHIDLFGLRQVARHRQGHGDHSPSFALPLPYRLVRHPMMLGFIPAFLAAPTMTVGHLLFAGLGCAYILLGVRLEERDLTAALPEYAAYVVATPGLCRYGAVERDESARHVVAGRLRHRVETTAHGRHGPLEATRLLSLLRPSGPPPCWPPRREPRPVAEHETPRERELGKRIPIGDFGTRTASTDQGARHDRHPWTTPHLERRAVARDGERDVVR